MRVSWLKWFVLHRRSSVQGGIYNCFPQCLNVPKGKEKAVSGVWNRICPLQQIFSPQYELVGVMKAKRKWVFLIHEARSRLSTCMERKICGLETLTWEWIHGCQPLRCLDLLQDVSFPPGLGAGGS